MPVKIALKIAVSLAFGIYLTVKIDFRQLVAVIQHIDIPLYIFSLLLIFANSLVIATKYRFLAKDSGNQQTIANLFRINLLCRFYSTFLTVAIGQGILRWHFSTQGENNKVNYVAIMVMERLTFLFALLLTIAIAVLFVVHPWIATQKHLLFGISTMGIIIVLSVFLLLSRYSFSEKLSVKERSFKNRSVRFIFESTLKIVQSFVVFNQKGRQIGVAIIISLLWQFIFVSRVYLLVIAMSLPFGFTDISWMASIVLFLQILPVSFNGLGIRETAYAQLFEFQSIAPENGVILGLLLFSHVLIMAAIGGVVHIFSRYSTKIR